MPQLNDYQIKLIAEGFVSSNKHESAQTQVDNLVKLLTEMYSTTVDDTDEKFNTTYRLVRFLPNMDGIKCELTGTVSKETCVVYDEKKNLNKKVPSVLMVDFHNFIEDEHDSDLLTLKPTVELL